MRTGALDVADLALRVGYWCRGLFDAVLALGARNEMHISRARLELSVLKEALFSAILQ